MTAALAKASWCLYGREDDIKAQPKLFKHVLVGNRPTSMAKNVQ